MITIKDLKEAGYKQFSSHKGEGLFQKKITDPDDKTLYFINFYLYRNPDSKEVFSAEVRFYKNDNLSFENDGTGETDFDVNLMIGDKATVDRVERFFGICFVNLDCVPDMHN